MQFDNQASRNNVQRQILDNNTKSNHDITDLLWSSTNIPNSKITFSSFAQIEDGMLALNGKVVCSISQLIYSLKLEQRKSSNSNDRDIITTTNEAFCSFIQDAKNLSDNSDIVKFDFIAFESLLFQGAHKFGMPVDLSQANSIKANLINKYEIYCNGKKYEEHFGFRDGIVTHFVKESGKIGFNQVNEPIKVDQLATQIQTVEKSMQLCSDFIEITKKSPSVVRSIFGAHSAIVLEGLAEIFENDTNSKLKMSIEIVNSMLNDYPFTLGITRANTVENKALTSFFVDSLIPLCLAEALCEYRVTSYILDDIWLKFTNRTAASYLESLDQILVQQPNDDGEFQPFSACARQIRQIGANLGYIPLI